MRNQQQLTWNAGGQQLNGSKPAAAAAAATAKSKSGEQHSTGRVVLAAVVHHLDDNYPPKRRAVDHSSSAAQTKDTHDQNNNSGCSNKTTTTTKLASRLASKLMFAKKKQHQLIDSRGVSGSGKGNEYSPPSERDQDENPLVDDGGNKVIEFKFDLIVDQMQEQQVPGESSKLEGSVLSLLDAFVLQSNDVCLMSVGKEEPTGQQTNTSNTNGYLFRLAARCVGQTFELLGGSSSSIELSATLFLSAGDRFESVDLLREEDNQAARIAADELIEVANSGSIQQTGVDCSSWAEAAALLDRIKVRCEQSVNRRAASCLLICSKLKRRINGGLFSNRMCLIDFDPKLAALKPILEATFTGHALAHLKRRKLHLQTLTDLHHNQLNQQKQLQQSVSIDQRILLSSSSDQSTTTTTTTPTPTTPSESEEEAKRKHHHQVASEGRLIQAEWLLYKQLSSALIRTLLIVHVHKLSAQSVCPKKSSSSSSSSTSTASESSRSDADDKSTREARTTMNDYEHRLMADNLQLLEFARSIQRASAQKLKRRRRHLRHHLAASSNASLASNVSETTTTTTTTDLLLLGSPVRSRMRQPLVSSTLSPHHLRQRQITNRKCSMDTSLALARHFRFHRQRSNADFSQQQQQHRAMDRLLRQTADLTESSSTSQSTSSGSAGCQQRRQSTSNFSDSDSVASATLNSYNSSRLESDRRRSSRDRRDIELKWLAKQKSTKAASCSAAQSPVIVQIDCCDRRTGSSSAATTEETTLCQTESVTIADDVSDICSVAEPPKELKLEKFLSQLSSSKSPSLGESNHLKVDEEEDDDCKSHSSIVDHLSSLAKELNCKLNYRLGQPTTDIEQDEQAKEDCHLDLFAAVQQQIQDSEGGGGCGDKQRTGYLQQLLNSSSQLAKRTQQDLATPQPQPTSRVQLTDSTKGCSLLESQLAELSINCQQQQQQQQASPSSGAFTFTSSSSSASASASSSVNVSPSDKQIGDQTLMRAQPNVKTSSC